MLAIALDRVEAFTALAARERCPFAVVGRATDDGTLVVEDGLLGDTPIDLPIAVLLGKPPRMTREASRVAVRGAPFSTAAIHLAEAVRRVLRLPAVADKTFLITIGDRTVGGLVARDQMVGPWQVPVADAAVTATSFDVTTGEAMAMGERPPVALLDAAASARLAIAEAITNIACAPMAKLSDIKLSANWMAAAGRPGRGRAALRRGARRGRRALSRARRRHSRRQGLACRCTRPGANAARPAASPRRCRWW